jgi:DNA-binding response OmpR family regulator
MELVKTHTVLLVEGDAALRKVISLGLRQQGISVLEAASAQAARALIAQRPSLLILDIDSSVAGNRNLLPDLRAQNGLAETPAVVLAWECSPEMSDHLASDGAAVCLAKPFDARHLFSKVELLLAALPKRSEQQERLAVAQTSSPSIWPVVLALGLMLVASGFLIHPAIIALGLVIVLGSMLLWGFEPGVRPGEA